MTTDRPDPPVPESSAPEPSPAANALEELQRLRTQFGPDAARRKSALLDTLAPARLLDPAQLLTFHDALLFLRAYPDDGALLRRVERLLREFASRVRACRDAAGEAAEEAFLDCGMAGTAVSHVFAFRMARALSALHPRDVEIDWETYAESETANLAYALAPAMLWPEGEAVDYDEEFDERVWLERSRGRAQPTSLAALFVLLGSSGLSERMQETLYDAAEVSIRWDLTRGAGSRTLRRLPWSRPFFQKEPFLGRTRDLRADLARPAAPLRLLPRDAGRRHVAAIHEVLGSRVRELYPVSGANPAEVYVYEPGRGAQIAVYGSLPEVRLPHETNLGALLVRNGLPIGYGVAAMLFERVEIAINIFPAYRAGESSYLIAEFFRLFVHHFGARVLLVRSYQVGDDNEEGLLSGAYWFYDKLGFRPVKPAVRSLARRERARLAADASYRSPLSTLKRLAKSDLFFHLDPSRMGGFDDLRVADLGYAVTRHIARTYAGDRQQAVSRSVARFTRLLGLGSVARWNEDEQRALRRMAPVVNALPGLERWPRDERILLGRIIRAKGGRRERDYVLLCQRHPRLESALRRMAAEEARRDAAVR